MSLKDILNEPARLAKLVEDAATADPRVIAEIQMPQGSEEWLAWRKGAVTATDAAVILSGRHYGKTAHSLWEEKTGLVEVPEPSESLKAAFARGHRDEPTIRAVACKQEDLYFMPCCAQAANVPFLKGSLDGLAFTKDGKKVVLECKSLSDLSAIRANPLGNPRLQGYTKQVKYLMALTHAEKAFIYMGVTDSDGALIDLYKAEISLTPEEARHILEAAVRFYACCLYKEDPDTSSFMEGFRVLEVEPAPAMPPAASDTAAPAPAPAVQAPAPAAPEAAPEFQDVGEEIAWLTAEISRLTDLKKSLIDACVKSGEMAFPSGEIKRVVRKGSIDYAKLVAFILEEYKIDISDEKVETFRKKNTESVTFYPKKEKKPE